jgi:hypothetical protein
VEKVKWPSGDYGRPDPYEEFTGIFKSEEEKANYIRENLVNTFFRCPTCEMLYDDLDMALYCCEGDVE